MPATIEVTDLGPWTSDDFDRLSWHDVHVHGFGLEAFEDSSGGADLVLDIDFILAWEKLESAFQFTVCQATLRFHQVFGLKVALDYATPTAGMRPFSIAGIEREALSLHAGNTSYRWRLSVNWPQGCLEFDAPEFTQALVGSPRVQASQWLQPEHRRGGAAT